MSKILIPTLDLEEHIREGTKYNNFHRGYYYYLNKELLTVILTLDKFRQLFRSRERYLEECAYELMEAFEKLNIQALSVYDREHREVVDKTVRQLDPYFHEDILKVIDDRIFNSLDIDSIKGSRRFTTSSFDQVPTSSKGNSEFKEFILIEI